MSFEGEKSKQIFKGENGQKFLIFTLTFSLYQSPSPPLLPLSLWPAARGGDARATRGAGGARVAGGAAAMAAGTGGTAAASSPPISLFLPLSPSGLDARRRPEEGSGEARRRGAAVAAAVAAVESSSSKPLLLLFC